MGSKDRSSKKRKKRTGKLVWNPEVNQEDLDKLQIETKGEYIEYNLVDPEFYYDYLTLQEFYDYIFFLNGNIKKARKLLKKRDIKWSPYKPDIVKWTADETLEFEVQMSIHFKNFHEIQKHV